MDVDLSNTRSSEYRVLFEDQIKYILVNANTFDHDILLVCWPGC